MELDGGIQTRYILLKIQPQAYFGVDKLLSHFAQTKSHLIFVNMENLTENAPHLPQTLTLFLGHCAILKHVHLAPMVKLIFSAHNRDLQELVGSV